MDQECENKVHHGHGGCCYRSSHHAQGPFNRHFLTKAEKVDRLEKYTQELKNELAAVQERIKELKAK